jgi:tetratricopeptide (TPR) repeat protein
MSEMDAGSPSAVPVIAPELATEAIALARAAAQRLDWQAAALLWNSVLQQSPSYIPAYLGAAKALSETSRLDEADGILNLAAKHFPVHEGVALAHAWNATSRRDWPVALQRWEDFCARFPDNPQAYRGMGRALRGANRPVELKTFLDTVQALLEAGESRPPDPDSLLDLTHEIARLRPDWPKLRRCAERIIERDEQPPTSAYLALSQSALHMGDHAAAEAASCQVLVANPSSTETLLLLVKLATERGDGEAALSYYAKLAALHPHNTQWRLKHTQLLNWMGRFDEAMDEAAGMLARRPHDPVVRAFVHNFGLADEMPPSAEPTGQQPGTTNPDAAARHELQILLDRAPKMPASARAAMTADPRRDVIIPEGANSDTAMLIFAGINDALSMPLEVFDRYVQPLDVLPIYLRDFNRLRYLTGIRSISYHYQGTIDGLRRMLREKGIKRLFTLGNCVGAFAAIRYGIELGAESIAAFHTPTYCPEETPSNFQVGHRFLRIRLAAKVGHEMADLKPFLEMRASGAPIELFYDAENREDERYARRIAHVRGVHLNPLPGRGTEETLRNFVLSHDNFSLWLAGMLAGTRLRQDHAPAGGSQNLPAAGA